MRERFLRIEMIGLPADEVAVRIGTSQGDLARWITGQLPVEDADIIEVGLSMLEMRWLHRIVSDSPTLPLSVIAA